MFCYKCGKVIDEGAVYCQYCGACIHQNDSQPSKQEMMRKLKRFKATEKCTCLECGYEGLMGIVEIQELPRKQRIGFLVLKIIAIIAVFPLLRFVNFAAGLIIGTVIAVVVEKIESSYRTKILFCPSCDKELVKN